MALSSRARTGFKVLSPGRVRKRLRPWWLVALLTGMVLLSSTALAGRRYFYCAMMEATSVSSCCHREPASGRASVAQADCCEPKVMAGLPSGDLRTWLAMREVPPAPLAFTIGAPSSADPLTCPSARVKWTRYGSDPPPPERRQARLMVFLV